MNEEHYRKLERVYLASPTNDYYQPTIQIEEGRSSIVIQAAKHLHHAAFAVHGSHYFKLLDDSAFFAANSLVGDLFVLTASFTVQFMRPVTTGSMRGTGRVTNRSRRLIWAESELRDEDGRLLATGSGTFMPSRVPLNADIGYA